MRPTVEALARGHRVLTFSLLGDSGSPTTVDASAGLDNFVSQIDEALDGAGLGSAAVCGVSFGGRVAIHYAVTRPARVDALILASVPGPNWKPDARVAGYLRRPILSTPAFITRAPRRLWPEVTAARGSRLRGALFLARHGLRALLAPMKPRLMAQRIAFLERIDVVGEARRVTAPALVVTGEPALDIVTDAADTRRFADLIPGARAATLDRTGHIGMITRPDEFARIVGAFLRQAAK